MQALGSTSTPASASRAATAAVRGPAPPVAQPMTSRRPMACFTWPGPRVDAAMCTTPPTVRAGGRSARRRPPGSTLSSTQPRVGTGASAGRPSKNHQGTPFMAPSTVVSAWLSAATASATAGRAGALTATRTRSCGPRAAGSSATVMSTRWLPAASSSRRPCSRTAASVAPRTRALTCTRSAGSRASQAANRPPMAPRPTMHTFMVRSPGEAVAARPRRPAPRPG